MGSNPPLPVPISFSDQPLPARRRIAGAWPRTWHQRAAVDGRQQPLGAAQRAQTLGADAHFMLLPTVGSSAALRNALVREAGVREVIDRWGHLDVVCVETIVVLLAGGDKRTHSRDIETAMRLARNL